MEERERIDAACEYDAIKAELEWVEGVWGGDEGEVVWREVGRVDVVVDWE